MDHAPPATRPPAGTANKVVAVRDLLTKSLAQIKMALPRHMSAERMLRVVMTAVQRTPALMECDQLSLIGAVVQASQLGLEPDGALGHAYLVPFNNKKTGRKEVQLIPGYRGLIDLARRSGQVSSLSAHVVYGRDQFDFAYGIEERLHHRPCMEKDRGEPVCVYAVARLKDGGYAFDVMSVAEVNAVRQRSRSRDDGPWVTDWPEMARKTVVRRLVKYLSLSPELVQAVGLDEAADAEIGQQLDAVVDVDSAALADATAQRQVDLRAKYQAQQQLEPPAADDSQLSDPDPRRVDPAPQRCMCPGPIHYPECPEPEKALSQPKRPTPPRKPAPTTQGELV